MTEETETQANMESREPGLVKGNPGKRWQIQTRRTKVHFSILGCWEKDVK